MRGDGRRLLHGLEQKLKQGRLIEDEPKSVFTFTLNGDRIADDESAIATCLTSPSSSQ